MAKAYSAGSPVMVYPTQSWGKETVNKHTDKSAK